eukprot:5319115-Pleurochrysis_carterae.AAC.1
MSSSSQQPTHDPPSTPSHGVAMLCNSSTACSLATPIAGGFVYSFIMAEITLMESACLDRCCLLVNLRLC